jgi:hypothetical protein
MMALRKWYELDKFYDDGDEIRQITEVFQYADTDDEARKAKAQMIARMAVARAIIPNVKFEGYVMTREKLDWVE